MWRASPHIAYVTPSRLATRTASSNSNSACACHTRTASSNRAQRVRALAFRTQLTSEELCGDRLASVKLKERGVCGGGGVSSKHLLYHTADARWLGGAEKQQRRRTQEWEANGRMCKCMLFWKAAAPCWTLAETN